MTSYLEVLEVDRSLFRTQLNAATARENYLTSIIGLYKAVGGGWKESDTTLQQ